MAKINYRINPIVYKKILFKYKRKSDTVSGFIKSCIAKYIGFEDELRTHSCSVQPNFSETPSVVSIYITGSFLAKFEAVKREKSTNSATIITDSISAKLKS